MIHSVQQSQVVANLYQTRLPADSPVAEPTKVKADPQDKVEISPAGKVMTESLEGLAPLTLDPAVHFANADKELKKLMDRYGVPAGTEVDITSDSRGNFKVEGDHPMLKQIEEDLNSGEAGDLRNSLIGGQTGLILQRIGMAMEMAMNAADKNPSKTEQYYDWVLNVASEAKGGSLSYTYQNGESTADLVAKNNRIITADTGLKLNV